MQSLSVIFDRPLEQKISEFLPHHDGHGHFYSGLLIGHRSASTIYVAHLARNLQSDAPVTDQDKDNKANESSPPKRQSKKQSPTVKNEPTFDEQSILHQARQVIRMLPGGLDIVGFFISGQKKQTDNVTPINKALRSAFKMSSRVNSMCGSVVNENPMASDGRMILLTLDSGASNKKPVSTLVIDCRPDAQATAPSTAVPFSYQNLRWRSLTTRVVFDVPLFVSKPHAMDSFLKQFTDSMRPWCRRLWTAAATINGQIRDEDEPLANVTSTASTTKGGKGKKQMDDQHESDIVDFYFLDDQENQPMNSGNSVDGVVSMHIRGTMYCVAFVHQKATVSEGVQALKVDAFRSLYGRCELHYDGMAILEGEELDPVAVHQFPRRVLAPLTPNSPIFMTDYLFEGDVTEDAVASFKDVLDMDLSNPNVIEDKVEIVPSEKSLENLLRSSSMSVTPEGSIDDIDRVQDLDDPIAKGLFGKQSLLYFVIAIIGVILAFLCFVFFFGKGD